MRPSDKPRMCVILNESSGLYWSDTLDMWVPRDKATELEFFNANRQAAKIMAAFGDFTMQLKVDPV